MDGKQVFLDFGSPTCGWCKLLDKFHADEAVARVIGKHFVLVKIDIVENPGGEDLYKKYGPQRGVPAWGILDGEAKVLADSGQGGEENIGFPYTPDEIDRYFAAIKKSGVKLSGAEVELLTRKLHEVAPPRSESSSPPLPQGEP